jgi:ABC-2 type transport system permease protein
MRACLRMQPTGGDDMATAATTAPQTRAPARPAGFANTLASEWTKLASLRSTAIMLLLGVGLGIAMSALIAVVIGSTWGEWPAEEQATFDPALTSLFGTIFTAILFVVLGVTAVTSEYSSGMIRLTLTATPRRGRVLAAKVIIIAVVTLVAGFVAIVGMFLIAQPIFSSYGIPSASLSDSNALRMVLLVALGGPIWPLIGLALGVLLRNTAGAITTVLALLFAPSIFGPLLPRWWQENVLRYLPGPASDNFATVTSQESALYMAAEPAALVVVGWLVLFLGGAYLALTRRDV